MIENSDRSQTRSGVIVGWSVVIDADKEFFWLCDESSIIRSNEYLIFEIGVKGQYFNSLYLRDYRTKGGVVWETREQKLWHERYGPVESRTSEGEWVKY